MYIQKVFGLNLRPIMISKAVAELGQRFRAEDASRLPHLIQLTTKGITGGKFPPIFFRRALLILWVSEVCRKKYHGKPATLTYSPASPRSGRSCVPALSGALCVAPSLMHP
ncbi:hypothetical protein TNCV_133761 [Trichonephila clavipes]|nr:hypothetical protein TNCV_133761 [Trichonephila clavipes]